MVRVGVTDADVASVALYTPLPWPMRLDLLPFLFLYATAAHLYASRPEDDVVAWVFGALSVFCHALALLGAEWSVEVRCWMSCARLTVVAPHARQDAGQGGAGARDAAQAALRLSAGARPAPGQGQGQAA